MKTQGKKQLCKKGLDRERKTVESYYCNCICSCYAVNCNPCPSTPSTAYLGRRDSLSYNRNQNAHITVYFSLYS